MLHIMRSAKIDQRRQPGHFPYYKVQEWDGAVRAWVDIQRRFPTPAAASGHAVKTLPDSHWRIMEVHRHHRRPLS